jgi:hypothetical protein
MFRFAKFTKLALLAAVVLAVVLSMVLGQPAYAQGAQTPSGTGKTLSAALLGKGQERVERSSFAGQTLRIRIVAADAASGSYAQVDTTAPFHDQGIKIYVDVVYNHTAEVQCTPNGAVIMLEGTHYRESDGTLVRQGSARVYVSQLSDQSDTLLFQMVDSQGARKEMTMKGKKILSNSTCS